MIAATPSDLAHGVLGCYRALFRDDRIGVDDDFFRLGGDSLHAVRLAGLIAQRLGHVITLQAITEAASPAALAARIAGPTSPVSGLVQLQPGAGPAMFFAHGLGGHAMSYRALAAAIDPARAMYGLEAAGLDADAPLPASIEDMARDYLARIRHVQPTGPYLLVGGSFGGTVAYEMARQLAAAGHAVPLCAMLDAPGPGALPPGDVDFAAMLGLLLGDALPPDALRGLAFEEQVARALAAGHDLPFRDAAHARRLLAVWRNNSRALADYTAPAWPDGEVQFFVPRTATPRLPPNLERAWLGRCAVRVEHVDGDHLTMSAPPHAAALGARIRRCLERCP